MFLANLGLDLMDETGWILHHVSTSLQQQRSNFSAMLAIFHRVWIAGMVVQATQQRTECIRIDCIPSWWSLYHDAVVCNINLQKRIWAVPYIFCDCNKATRTDAVSSQAQTLNTHVQPL
jgi:hypothetical protein